MRKLFKGLVTAVAAVTIVALPQIVHADFNPGDYTGNGQPQFNVYNDVPGIGNEHDFVRVGAENADAKTYTNNFDVCSASQARVWVYIHNGAPEGFNDPNNTGSGVAKGVKLQVKLTTGDNTNFPVQAVISASNAPSVSDTAAFTCNGQKVTLSYKSGSAEIFSQERGEQPLSDDVVKNGTPVGSFSANGVVPGCWDFRNYVSLVVNITKTPVTPVTPVTPAPVLPTVVPNTGPGDVAAIFVATAAAGALAYRVYISRRQSRQ